MLRHGVFVARLMAIDGVRQSPEPGKADRFSSPCSCHREIKKCTSCFGAIPPQGLSSPLTVDLCHLEEIRGISPRQVEAVFFSLVWEIELFLIVLRSDRTQ